MLQSAPTCREVIDQEVAAGWGLGLQADVPCKWQMPTLPCRTFGLAFFCLLGMVRAKCAHDGGFERLTEQMRYLQSWAAESKATTPRTLRHWTNPLCAVLQDAHILSAESLDLRT